MAFNFRIAERQKRHLVDFFQKIFVLYSENKVQLNDGYNKIVFSKSPKCQVVDTYDFKYFPVLLIGVSNVATKDCSLNKFKDYYTDELGIVSAIYGGFATVTLNFQIRAQSEDERNNLADIVCSYLTSVETKRFLLKTYGMRILGAPSYTGESSEDDPQTNVKQFVINLSLTFESDYEEGQDIVDTLGNIGITLEDVIAYTPVVHGKVVVGDNSPAYNTFTAVAVAPDIFTNADGYYTDFTLRFTSDTVNSIVVNVLGYTAATGTFVVDNVGIVIPNNATFELRGGS